VAEPLDRLPDGLVGESPGLQFLLEDDIRQEVQRPGTAGLPEAPRGLVEDALERIGPGLVEDRSRVLGSALLLVQAAWPFGFESVQGVPNRPDRTSDLRGDPSGSLTLGAGQEDLGAPQRERLPTSETGLEGLTLRIREFTNEQGWFHDPLFGPTASRTSNRMRLH